jgi:hypothetical protein
LRMAQVAFERGGEKKHTNIQLTSSSVCDGVVRPAQHMGQLLCLLYNFLRGIIDLG